MFSSFCAVTESSPIEHRPWMHAYQFAPSLSAQLFSLKTTTPSFAKTTILVARALGMTPDELRACFQPAQLRHLPSITNLRSQGSPVPWDDARYLRWRYDLEGRPDSRGCLMVVARGDQVLGMIGAENVRLIRGDQTVDALSMMDILVDPEVDGAGLGVWLNMAIFANNPVVVEMGANPNSIGLITRLFHRLPNRKQYTVPLRFRPYLAKRWRSRTGRLAAPMLAAPANVAFKVWRAIAFHRIPSSWSLRHLTRFDDSVDRLFARRWGSDDITFERSSRYLNWRLFENPRAKYSVLAAFEAGDMVAYVAYRICNEASGMRIVRLIDWLVDARHGFAGFSVLAQEIIRRALAERVDLVSVSPLHARIERSLWRLGFLTRPSSEFATVGVSCTEPVPWPDLLDGSAWCLTDANSDPD